MTFPRRASGQPVVPGLHVSFIVAAIATWVTLSVTGCSVDSKGFGGVDGGGGGTGGTTGSGGATGGSTGGGGVTGTGGIPGTGGEHGSGGTTGSGGRGSGGEASGGHGSGGATGGSGGHASSGGENGGGHAGSGNGGHAMGTGGAAGSPGTGGEGMGGASGGGGKGGETCAQLADDYAKALPDARACTPNATGQCQQLAPTSLSYCMLCSQYVNDATRLTAIRAQWTAEGCAVPTVCPAIACIAPVSSCVANDPGPGGTCQSMIAVGAN